MFNFLPKHRFGGMLPVNLLFVKSKRTKLLLIPKLGGMTPENWLLNNEMFFSCLKSASPKAIPQKDYYCTEGDAPEI